MSSTTEQETMSATKVFITGGSEGNGLLKVTFAGPMHFESRFYRTQMVTVPLSRYVVGVIAAVKWPTATQHKAIQVFWEER